MQAAPSASTQGNLDETFVIHFVVVDHLYFDDSKSDRADKAGGMSLLGMIIAAQYAHMSLAVP